jgi:sugar lactone lactonase YvrE
MKRATILAGALAAAVLSPGLSGAQAPIYVGQWGSYGTGPGQFRNPRGIALDHGYVYVVDTNNHRVQKFDELGIFVSSMGSFGYGPGQLQSPADVAADHAGNLFIVTNNYVNQFSTEGAYITRWPVYDPVPGISYYLLGIAVDATGNVFVVDSGDSPGYQVLKFSRTGALITKWGSQGQGNGRFEIPEGIAVDPAGYVYVADTFNDRIQKFTNDGTFVTKWGMTGSDNGKFIRPIAVETDGAGHVYVADLGNSRIQKFTDTGTFLAKWGTSGTGDGQFDQAEGVTAAADGVVYVSDYGNHRVQKFGPSSLLDVPPSPVGLELAPPRPNPFRGSTRLAFTLPRGSVVTLALHDVSGREVARPIDGTALEAGPHAIEFHAPPLSSGIYLVTLNACGFRTSRRLIAVR